ncbi:MAG: tRNA pseudouridine(55) synthase TruB [Bacteroidales bacterium]|nr:tRNA pseudouridine(55) synthase TruB [Bacteroidales bacterium]
MKQSETFYLIDKKGSNLKLSRNLEDYPGGIVLVLDKPLKWTSADAVRKLKFKLQRYFNQKNIKVGHAGTLDPLATGILLICIGKATRSAEKLQSESKEYIADIRFGATTPSYDLEKEIDSHYPFEHIDINLIKSLLDGLKGEIDQIPPIFSAKLIDGKRAYEIARAGKEAEMKPSRVSIYDLQVISYNKPDLKIAISCSKGTYIRSFARDIGIAAESGAHLAGLVRSASGQFRLEDALTMEDAETLFEIS